VSGAVPVAATVKVAVWPAVTVTFTGCVVNAGFVAAAFTVRVTMLLGALPFELLTVTWIFALLSDEAVAAVVYVAEFVPTFIPFLVH
jgi:hypothetical protein